MGQDVGHVRSGASSTLKSGPEKAAPAPLFMRRTACIPAPTFGWGYLGRHARPSWGLLGATRQACSKGEKAEAPFD